MGLVAGIQLSANNMISLGDWLEMPKYGADGAVVDISLTTVKKYVIGIIPLRPFLLIL